jgi:hypothetical protein
MIIVPKTVSMTQLYLSVRVQFRPLSFMYSTILFNCFQLDSFCFMIKILQIKHHLTKPEQKN